MKLGTHFIRRLNDKKQKWYGKKDKYDIRSCIQTEEGFACVNQYSEYALIPKKKPFLYRAALNYYSAYHAGLMSFAELYKDLEHYIDDPNRRWNYVLRVKRGITDTNIPGGLYKDQVYLEGAIKILKDRKSIKFLCTNLRQDISRRFEKKLFNENIEARQFNDPTLYERHEKVHERFGSYSKSQFHRLIHNLVIKDKTLNTIFFTFLKLLNSCFFTLRYLLRLSQQISFQ